MGNFMANLKKLQLLYQRSNFRSKVVSKIIAEAEAKKTVFDSAVPRQTFCRRN